MKKYIVYDGRAIAGDEDDASVLSIADSLKEAQEDCKDFGESCVYEYDLVKGEFKNGELIHVFIPERKRGNHENKTHTTVKKRRGDTKVLR